MRVQHASPDMVQAPSSPGTLIGDDIPEDTYFEKKLPSPLKQYHNSQPSAAASLQVPARVTEKAFFPTADALILAFKQQQRYTREQIQGLPDDQRRREFQMLLIKLEVLCNSIEQVCGVLRLARSMIHSHDTQDLGTRPGGGKITQLSDSHRLEKNGAGGAMREKGNSGDVKASLNANGHRPKKLIVKLPFKYPLSDKRPLPEDQAENSADVKTTFNPNGHRPKELIVKLPFKAPLGGKRPLPEYEVEEGDKDMAGATRAVNPQKKRRLAARPLRLCSRLDGRTSRSQRLMWEGMCR